MITKTTDKSAKSDRSAVVRRPVRSKTASMRASCATTLVRKAFPEKQPAEGRVTKHTQLLQLLSRPEGASIKDMMNATEWQQHSVRGFLAGTVKKKMGLTLTSSKTEGDVRRYRIAAPRRGR